MGVVQCVQASCWRRPVCVSISCGVQRGLLRYAVFLGLLVFLLVGGVAGWLAGQIMKGFGFGLIGNIVVGIIGAFVAGFVLPIIGVSIGGGIIGSIIHATIGAVILLFVIGLVRKSR